MMIKQLKAIAYEGYMIDHGPKAGPRNYKDALYSTLVQLKPRRCLEIGTHFGGSSLIFTKYFDEYMPDGELVTVDIKQYCRLNDRRIKQVRVYPHTKLIFDHHNIYEDDLIPDWEQHIYSSAIDNSSIVGKGFDFCFLDGDHTAESFRKDLIFAENCTNPPHHILIDDTQDTAHDCCRIYHNEVKKEWKSYDFDDWDFKTGCSLVWK